jgi:hypothetical protein
MMVDPNPTEENVTHTVLQIKAIAANTWALTHQSLCNMILPAFVVFLFFSKGYVPSAA